MTAAEGLRQAPIRGAQPLSQEAATPINGRPLPQGTTAIQLPPGVRAPQEVTATPHRRAAQAEALLPTQHQAEAHHPAAQAVRAAVAVVPVAAVVAAADVLPAEVAGKG